jgi:hypothetical protein
MVDDWSTIEARRLWHNLLGPKNLEPDARTPATPPGTQAVMTATAR